MPTIYKRKFKAYTHDGTGSVAFRRLAYNLLVNPLHILVHYVDDETVAVEAPHETTSAAILGRLSVRRLPFYIT